MVDQKTPGRLDDDQLRVARAHPGPVLVTGGPGTGKTAALIGRVAALLNGGISGRNIFFLTTSPWRGADMSRELPGRLAPLAPRLPAERLRTVRAGTLEDLSADWLCTHGAVVLGIPTDFRVWNPRRAVRAAINLAAPEARQIRLSDREVRSILRFHWLQRSRTGASQAPGAPVLWQEVWNLYQEEKPGGMPLPGMTSYPWPCSRWSKNPAVLSIGWSTISKT
jgi:superfamily I DNA/RNA helicase